jgi:hypothetical protein
MLLAIVAMVGPVRRDPVMSIDDFILKRVDEDGKRAIANYLKDLSQVQLDRVVATCDGRRKMVSLFRTSRDRPEANAAYALVLTLVAEVYDDHPDYDERWRPMLALADPGLTRVESETLRSD